MKALLSEIDLSRKQIKKEQGRIINKIDSLIADAVSTKQEIETSLTDVKAVNQELVRCVKRGQENFKKVVNLNKNYYDVLSRQSKSITSTFEERQDAFRTEKTQRQRQELPKDLDSLFFPEIATFDKDLVNELITEHMVLDDPNSLAEVIKKFQSETGCQIGEELIAKQRNLRRIVPPLLPREGTTADLINIDLALEWLQRQNPKSAQSATTKQGNRSPE